MKKHNYLFYGFILVILIILSLAVASLTLDFGEFSYFVFYNIVYGIIISTIIPLFFIIKSKENLTSIGFKKIGLRQIIVLVSFVGFSIGGQIIPKIALGNHIAYNLLAISILPLIMTTFFEEFLFRGFLQTRIEKQYGSIIAILASGALFSVYHLGYPGFRTVEDTLILLAVGIGFAIAYKLSDNNLIISYFINLPNAFITYMLKSEQFPPFTKLTSIYAGVTIVIICILMFYARKKINRCDCSIT